MAFFPERLVKRFKMPNGNCVDIVARPDGHFQYCERLSAAGSDDCNLSSEYTSDVFISAETAEAAARNKFSINSGESELN